jgi:hypothetical protein
MRRTDLFLVIVLVVLVLILVVGIALRPQPGAPQQNVAIPANTEDRLAAAQADVEALQAQLALPTAAPGAINFDEWETITGSGVSVSLPSRFNGGEFSEEFLQSALELDPSAAEVLSNYSAMLELLDLELIAYDSQFTSPEFVTNLNITRAPLEGVGENELALAFDAIASQLPPAVTLIRRDLIALQGQTALRLDVENAMFGTVPLRQLIYILSRNNGLLTLTYSAHNAEFSQWLPIFEISARTFAITG